jgi:hypothetical protein
LKNTQKTDDDDDDDEEEEEEEEDDDDCKLNFLRDFEVANKMKY